MVIEAPLRTGLGVAARPDALVEGVDRGIIAGRVPRQHPLKGRLVDGPFGQGIVQTAPPAAVCRLEAQVRERGHRTSRQEGIDQLEQGVGASRVAAVQVGAKGAEGREVMSGHTAQRARRPRRWPTRSTTAPARVKSQAKVSAGTVSS